jgi:hypothetical protein
MVLLVHGRLRKLYAFCSGYYMLCRPINDSLERDFREKCTRCCEKCIQIVRVINSKYLLSISRVIKVNEAKAWRLASYLQHMLSSNSHRPRWSIVQVVIHMHGKRGSVQYVM